MAPFLKDEGPPVSTGTIAEARRTLAPEYGHKVVHENGRKVLLVRSPRPRPDYLHELEDAALYVTLDEVKDVKDVLLVGTEKVCRMEPLLLRDHIRSRATEDRAAAEALLRTLPREYGFTVYKHPESAKQSIAFRIPRGSVAEITADDVKAIRGRISALKDQIGGISAGYLISDADFERLGRRLYLELIDPELAAAAVPKPAPVPASVPLPIQATTPPPTPAASRPAIPSGPFGSLMPTAQPPPAPKPGAAPPAAARPVAPPKELVAEDENIAVFVRKAAPPPAPPPAVVETGPVHDNGAVLAPTAMTTDALPAVEQKLRSMGYEAVAGVTVQGTTFDLAAHRREGKRLLLKKVESVTADDVKKFETVARSVGCDVCILLTSTIAPGARAAALGTHVVVTAHADALALLE